MENGTAKTLHDLLLASKPGEAKHDSDICAFCVDEKASASTASAPSGPDVSDDKHTEGGASPTMTEISMETHEALVQQKVTQAVQAADAALATKTEEAQVATAKVAELETELASVKEELAKASTSLDEAQAKVNTLTEDNTKLKDAAEKAEADKELAEKASKRGEQVTNLKLFPAEYVTERASKWAELSDEAWETQLEDYKKLKPADAGEGGDSSSTDAASAMTGTDGDITATQDTAGSGGDNKVSARRAVLGLG